MGGKSSKRKTKLRSELQDTVGEKMATDTTAMPCASENELCSPSDISVTKVLEFSTKRPDDVEDVNIHGVLTLDDKFVIVDDENRQLKLYTESGEYLCSETIPKTTWGITKVDSDRFATCGYGEQIFMWKIFENKISQEAKTYNVDLDAYGIHFNGTYYCVLHHLNNAVTILDEQVNQVRKFSIKEVLGKKVDFGWDIHSDRHTHHVYIPCKGNTRGVLCVSIDGEVLRFNALAGSPRGITELHGFLCVTHFQTNCVHLVSKNWKSQSKLLDANVMKGSPDFIAVNASEDKLMISYAGKDVITVFTLK